MSLLPGTRFGPYEITTQIGVGGMGEVYRATDTNLKRTVALKVLPASMAADAERLARFQREAEVLAALNHPHIAAIYGLERSGSATALVIELVEGEDLSQRLARGPIPVDEALAIAKQIAEALEAAHEQGIIHRDLKPANIKVRSDGTVKVLDFGLAKTMEPAGVMAQSLAQSPTITTPVMTQAGVILGTAAYMLPEQARGKTVDKRADIWAFGAVLFEMLTGRRAFAGEDITDTIVSVISKEPDWSALPAATSASVRSLLRRCLDRDPKRRLRDIGEARLALEGGAFETIAAPASALSGRLVWMVAFAVAAVLATALAIRAVRHLGEAPPPAPPETRLDIATPATDLPDSFARPVSEAYERRGSGGTVRALRPGQGPQQLVGGRSLSAVLQHRSEDEHRPLRGADDPPISCFVPALGFAVLQGRGDAVGDIRGDLIGVIIVASRVQLLLPDVRVATAPVEPLADAGDAVSSGVEASCRISLRGKDHCPVPAGSSRNSAPASSSVKT